MKLEDQVCSLELAKRLKELGVKQESYLYWHLAKFSEVKNHNVPDMWIITDLRSRKTLLPDECSAFTVAEIWGKLPHKLDADNLTSFLVMKKVEQNDGTGVINTILNYEMISGTIHPWCQNEENPADACAKMLIHLIDQGLVKKEGE